MFNPEENNSAHYKTIFKQTFKFTKELYGQKISPEGFLIRDCGCVMRFLPNLDNKLNKIKLQPNNIKNQNIKTSSHTNHRKKLNHTIVSTEMNSRKHVEKNMNLTNIECKRSFIQNPSLYQSTFWMEPRVVPIKYTTEIHFNLQSPVRRFIETIDLQMKLVPCPYIQQIGTTKRFKTSVETRIHSEHTLPLDTTT